MLGYAVLHFVCLEQAVLTLGLGLSDPSCWCNTQGAASAIEFLCGCRVFVAEQCKPNGKRCPVLAVRGEDQNE